MLQAGSRSSTGNGHHCFSWAVAPAPSVTTSASSANHVTRVRCDLIPVLLLDCAPRAARDVLRARSSATVVIPWWPSTVGDIRTHRPPVDGADIIAQGVDRGKALPGGQEAAGPGRGRSPTWMPPKI